MRKILGFAVIFCMLPMIFITYTNAMDEWSSAETFQRSLGSSVTLDAPTFPSPVTMYDRDGNLFSEDYVEWRQPLTLDEIPSLVQDLFVLSEDQDFYEHIGYDLSAIVRALWVNTESNSSAQGGSTITQQLVRMRYLTTEKTYERKVTELIYAYELEKHTSKEEILEMYLNEMYFSNKVYGIGGAASYYFNKNVSDCSVAELAFLASIPNNPSLYDPINHFDATKQRQERLLDLLVSNNRISKEEADTYKKEPIQLSLKLKKQQAPAYSTYVLAELKELVAQKEGYEEKLLQATTDEEKKSIKASLDVRLKEIMASGIRIDTALDQTKQQQITRRMDRRLSSTDLQAGGVVINNETRDIAAIYGGKSYKRFDFNRAYQAVRQPGSSIKPLLDYGPYFDTNDVTPEQKISAGKYCVGTYCPQNYGGAVYGDVTLRQALRFSYNTPALQLFERVGIETAFSYLNQFHFRSITEKDYGYPSAIGGFENGVTALEMADAFTSFLNGQYKTAHAIRSVKDKDGNALYEWEQPSVMVWKPKTVEIMRDLLHDVVENGTGRGIQSDASYVGAKTGTTNDYHDFWLAGLTDQYTAAVWLGYDQPQNMEAIEDQKIHHDLFSILIQ